MLAFALHRLRIVALVACGVLFAGAARAAPGKGPEGIWLGALEVSGMKLRLAFHIARAADGALTATLDSLDQGATGIAVDRVTVSGSTLRLEVAKLHASFEGTLDGDKLVGTFTQGAALPLALARVDRLDGPRRPQHPAPPFPYAEEEVAIEVAAAPLDPARASERIRLAGTLTRPPGAGPFPAVVLITGSGPQDRDETLLGHKPFLVLADALTRRGIATLRLDDRGVGKSTGTLTGATTLDFAEDVRAVLAWLAARPEIDPRAIGLVGHSEGGVIAPIVASKDDRARFVVMLAGTGMTGDKILLAQSALIARAAGQPEAAIAKERAASSALFARLRAAKADAEVAAAVDAYVAADPGEREAGASLLRSRWLRTFLTLDPAAFLAKVRVPVLAISGERDLQVPKDNLPAIAAALRRARNPDVTVKPLPELNHLFQHCKTGAPSEYAAIEETFSPDALQLVVDWVAARSARLQRAAGPRTP